MGVLFESILSLLMLILDWFDAIDALLALIKTFLAYFKVFYDKSPNIAPSLHLFIEGVNNSSREWGVWGVSFYVYITLRTYIRYTVI